MWERPSPACVYAAGPRLITILTSNAAKNLNNNFCSPLFFFYSLPSRFKPSWLMLHSDCSLTFYDSFDIPNSNLQQVIFS